METVNFKLAQELSGERANRLGNRKRLIKLLDLLTVGLNGHADERAFAKVIRLPLEGHDGRPCCASDPTTTTPGRRSTFEHAPRARGRQRGSSAVHPARNGLVEPRDDTLAKVAQLRVIAEPLPHPRPLNLKQVIGDIARCGIGSQP